MSWTSLTECCDSTTAILGVAGFLACLYLLRRPKNFPPGPHGFPLIGYIPFLGENAGETFRKMKPKYGPVMSVQLGREDWVVLNDYDTINEALVKQSEKFSGRPNNLLYQLITEGRGITCEDYGPVWKSLRKFGLMTLRGFGVGKKGMEENSIAETPLLIENLTTKGEQNLHMKLTLAVSNIICRIVFGSRFEYEDKRFTKMVDIIRMFFSDSKDARYFGVMSFAPILRFVPPFRGSLKRTLEDIDIFMDHIREIIDEHEASYDENDIRDFIDAFLKEMKTKEEDDPSFNKKQLVQLIRDLFEAGTGTTSSTICWAVLCLANYPECQEKIAKEIDNTLGESGLPSMKHREEMPYTCAFIHELMRHRTLLPLSGFHKTTDEVILGGYTIPKDTTISPNLWSVHFDPEYFENPREFRPQRFLDRDGKFVKSNHVIPFSIGPRHCLGEQLAKMEIFIFLTGIVQKLRVVPDSHKPLPPLESGTFNMMTLEPPAFFVDFERR